MALSATDLLDAYISQHSSRPQEHPLRVLYPGQACPANFHRSYQFPTCSSKSKCQPASTPKPSEGSKEIQPEGSKAVAQSNVTPKHGENRRTLPPARATAKSAAVATANRLKVAGSKRNSLSYGSLSRTQTKMLSDALRPAASAPEASVTSRSSQVVKSTALAKLRLSALSRQPSASANAEIFAPPPTLGHPFWPGRAADLQTSKSSQDAVFTKGHKEETTCSRATETQMPQISSTSSCASTRPPNFEQQLASDPSLQSFGRMQGASRSSGSHLSSLVGSAGGGISAANQSCSSVVEKPHIRASFEASNVGAEGQEECTEGEEGVLPAQGPASERGSLAESHSDCQTSTDLRNERESQQAAAESVGSEQREGLEAKLTAPSQAIRPQASTEEAANETPAAEFKIEGRRLVAVGRLEMTLDFRDAEPLPKLRCWSSRLLPQRNRECSFKTSPSVAKLELGVNDEAEVVKESASAEAVLSSRQQQESPCSRSDTSGLSTSVTRKVNSESEGAKKAAWEFGSWEPFRDASESSTAAADTSSRLRAAATDSLAIEASNDRLSRAGSGSKSTAASGPDRVEDWTGERAVELRESRGSEEFLGRHSLSGAEPPGRCSETGQAVISRTAKQRSSVAASETVRKLRALQDQWQAFCSTRCIRTVQSQRGAERKPRQDLHLREEEDYAMLWAVEGDCTVSHDRRFLAPIATSLPLSTAPDACAESLQPAPNFLPLGNAYRDEAGSVDVSEAAISENHRSETSLESPTSDMSDWSTAQDAGAVCAFHSVGFRSEDQQRPRGSPSRGTLAQTAVLQSCVRVRRPLHPRGLQLKGWRNAAEEESIWQRYLARGRARADAEGRGAWPDGLGSAVEHDSSARSGLQLEAASHGAADVILLPYLT